MRACLRLTVDLQVSFESGASSWILGFALVRSRVLQLNVGNFQHGLRLPKPRFFGDVAVYLPPCDCWHGTARREKKKRDYILSKHSVEENEQDLRTV